MASSKVMASASPPNPDLPRQSPSSAIQQQQHSSSSSSSSSTGLTQTTITPSTVSNLLLNQPNPQPTSAIIINNNSNNNNNNNNNSHLHYSDRTNSPFGSMNMEEILKNIYSEPDSLASAVDDAAVAISAVPPPPPVIDVDATAGGIVVKNGGDKTVDDMWTGFVNGGGGDGNRSREQGMTLEAFLAKAGAVNEEDVRVNNSASTAVSVPVSIPVPAPVTASGGYGVEALMNVQFPVAPGAMVVHMQNEPGGFGLESPLAAFANGMVAAPSAAAAALGGNGSSSGRGKRRVTPVEELALDKATQQKQRRMIKNRESAARSRERKQAYTVELESLVTQLEEENARLLREEEQQNKDRFKQLMENLIPVVEKRRPPRVLRRVNSSSW